MSVCVCEGERVWCVCVCGVCERGRVCGVCVCGVCVCEGGINNTPLKNILNGQQTFLECNVSTL